MMIKRYCALTFLLLSTLPVFAQPARMSYLSTYKSGIYNAGGAEIVAFDAPSKKLFVVNAKNNRVDILDVSNPAQLVRIDTISYAAYGAGVNSVAVKNGLVAAAVESAVRTDAGKVVVHTTNGVFRGETSVGSLPDMVTFNESGNIILVANEGEPNADYSVDPEGSVSIVYVVDNGAAFQTVTADFKAFNFGGSRRSEIDTLQIRVYGKNATVAQDLEPEYITVVGDSAYVTLQENNAIGLLRISTGTWTWLKPLGFKDHSVPGNGLDASDRDDAINIANWPVKGMYQPDAIASFRRNGQLYLATANEGDAREYTGFAEEARVSTLDLNDTVFPNEPALKVTSQLGRLTVTNLLGKGANGFESLYVLGGRSFSIWDASGARVFDSGDDFERVTAAVYPDNFNASNNNNNRDDRSDNKGPEPEAITVGSIGDSLYAFIALERVGGVMMYNISNPVAPKFIQYINYREFSVVPGAGTVNTVGDLGPEALVFIPADQSPNGKALLAVGNEISGTTTLYQVERGTGTSNEKDATPISARLLGNYPNPFNPSTTIRYELGYAQPVKIQVFDMMGRLVSTLADGVRPAGISEIRFDASKLSSGMYLIRMQSAKVLEVSKMNLVK